MTLSDLSVMDRLAHSVVTVRRHLRSRRYDSALSAVDAVGSLVESAREERDRLELAAHENADRARRALEDLDALTGELELTHMELLAEREREGL